MCDQLWRGETKTRRSTKRSKQVAHTTTKGRKGCARRNFMVMLWAVDHKAFHPVVYVYCVRFGVQLIRVWPLEMRCVL